MLWCEDLSLPLTLTYFPFPVFHPITVNQSRDSRPRMRSAITRELEEIAWYLGPSPPDSNVSGLGLRLGTEHLTALPGTQCFAKVNASTLWSLCSLPFAKHEMEYRGCLITIFQS